MKHRDILIVDDEKRYADMLAKRLALRGLHCEICHDGASALSLLERHFFPMVILDLQLPDIYGIDVLAEIKRIRSETAVIILTGHGTQKDRNRSLAQGAHAFMHKPMDIDRLMAIMAHINKTPV